MRDAADTEAELANRSANAELVRLVQAYRTYGHLLADLDPLGLQPARCGDAAVFAPQECPQPESHSARSNPVRTRPPRTVSDLNPSNYRLGSPSKTYDIRGACRGCIACNPLSKAPP